MNKYVEDLEMARYLLEKYDCDSLTQIKLMCMHKMPKFRCPKCEGKGNYSISYNAYPPGLPDSGWVFKQGWKNKTCDICNGEGYINEEVVRIEKHLGDKVEYDGFCTKDGSKTWKEREKGENPW